MCAHILLAAATRTGLLSSPLAAANPTRLALCSFGVRSGREEAIGAAIADTFRLFDTVCKDGKICKDEFLTHLKGISFPAFPVTNCGLVDPQLSVQLPGLPSSYPTYTGVNGQSHTALMCPSDLPSGPVVLNL